MAEALKDSLYNRQFFDDLAATLYRHYPSFDREQFIARIYDDTWAERALKDRMRHTTTVLHDLLPDDYRAALDVLKAAAPELEGGGFLLMSFCDFVERYGLDDWEASIAAMELFTQYSSAEFAVRPFIMQDTSRMMAQMLAWARHDSHHVRRLASEGCRPRLPWAMALPMFKHDPSPILPILERLKNDPSDYVRRSVANNLNDIAKDNPDVVIDVARRWQKGATDDTQWIIRHALRSLIKAGHSDALELLGYGQDVQVAVENIRLSTDKIQMGESIMLSFDVVSGADEPQTLMIDYIVHFQKANGTLAPKVFKLTQKTLQPGERLHIEKSHTIRPITTRTYYPGEHAISIQINGTTYDCGRFALEMD